jgi:hypothetical protein
MLVVEDDDVDVMTVERVLKHLGRDRNTARATLGKGLSVSASPLYVPVQPLPQPTFPQFLIIIIDHRQSRWITIEFSYPRSCIDYRGSFYNRLDTACQFPSLLCKKALANPLTSTSSINE